MLIMGLMLRSVVLGLARVCPRLHVGAQFVHAVQRIQQEHPGRVDLHQGQVIQLQRGERRVIIRETMDIPQHSVSPLKASGKNNPTFYL